ncbi:MAG: hypothetical protein DRP89_08605, partial [Candidatus Neomarinimicrobiota bacterium]
NTIVKKLGFSKNEIIGKNVLDFIVPKQKEKVAAQLRRYFKGEFAPETEVNIYAKDRSIRTLLFSSGNLSLKEKEQPDKVLITGIDVTGYKRMEQALKESEHKLRSFIDSSSIGIWCFRLNNPIDITLSDEKMLGEFFKSKCVECNDTYATMMGTTKNKILGTVLNEVMPNTKENREYLKKFIHNNFKISGGISHEIGKNGLEKYFSNSMTATIEDGKLIEAWGTQTDITNLKQTEKKIKLLSQITENSPVAMVLLDMNKKITYVNPFFSKLYGYDSEEISNKPVAILSGEDDPEKHYSNIFNIIGSKGLWRGHDRRKRKDGTIFWASSSVTEIKDENRNIFYYSEASRDISEQKRMEKALHESEKQFRTIFENMTIGMYRTTPDGRILMANPALIRMLGYSSFEELSHRNLEDTGFELRYPRSNFKQRIESEGKVIELESAWKRRDGTTLFVRENSRIIRDDNGNVLYYEGTVEDITERKKSEKELQESEEKYRSLIESSEDSIYLVDKNLNYLHANKKLLSRYEKPLKEVIGQNYSKFHSTEGTEKFSKKIRHVLESANPITYEYKSRRDGKYFIRTLSPVIDEKTGETSAVTVISKDITKRKWAEERIEHLNKIILAIRNVNQLITKENDRDNLIKKACSLLVEKRGYLNSWIVLLDKSGKVILNANSGFGKLSSQLSEFFKSGGLPECGREALKQSDIVITEAKDSICAECPVLNLHSNKKTLTVRLEYGSNIYGLISVTLSMVLVKGTQEESLFGEVAGDIAFALYNIEMEKERKKLEELESSILHSVPFAIVGLHERQITFANESVKDVFGWEAEELIGKNTRILYRSDEEYKEIADHFYPVLEKQQYHYEEFPFRHKDGKDIICMVRASRIGEKLKEREIV